MAKRYHVWWLASGLWVLIAAINAYNRQAGVVIGYNIFAAVLLALLGAAQYRCDKTGRPGKTAMAVISIVAVAIVVVVALTLLFIPTAA